MVTGAQEERKITIARDVIFEESNVKKESNSKISKMNKFKRMKNQMRKKKS